MSDRAPSRIPYHATNLPVVIPPEHQARSTPVGVALVDPWESAWGRSNDTFSPADYVEYAATSVYVYSAIRIRANNMGKLQPKLWKLRRGGRREEVTRGPLFELIHRVNPFWSFAKLLRMSTWSRLTGGSAFWVLNRGMSGNLPPSEIWWARPDYMQVLPHPVDYIAGYVFERQGQRIAFDANEVLWLPMDNPIDEFAGLSPIAAVRLSIDTAHDAMRANQNIHRNGSHLGGIIAPASDDATLTREQRQEFSHVINTEWRGASNAHKLAIMSHAIKLVSTTLAPKDAQFVEQLKWTLGDVARAFGVPAGLLQDREHSTYNNLDQDYRGLWTETIIPDAEDIANQVTEFLLPMFPGEADEFTLDYSHIPQLQEDRTEVAAIAYRWWQMGVPLNPLLQEYAPNLLPAGAEGYEWGDEQGGGATAGDAMVGAATEPPTTDDPARAALALIRGLREGQRAIAYGSDEHRLRWQRVVRQMERHERRMRDELRRLFARQQESVLARLRKRSVIPGNVKVSPEVIPGNAAGNTRDDDDAAAEPFDLGQWEPTFAQAMLPLFTEAMQDAGEETLADLGITGGFDIQNPAVRNWLTRAAQRFAQQVNQTTWETLRESLADGIDAGESVDELADRVREVFTDATETRAETIAITETASAVNAGALEGAIQSGVVSMKVWASSLDDRVRESHVEAHGQTVGLEEDFVVGSGRGPTPGQLGVAEEDIRCRCVMLFQLDDGRIMVPTVMRRA